MARLIVISGQALVVAAGAAFLLYLQGALGFAGMAGAAALGLLAALLAWLGSRPLEGALRGLTATITDMNRSGNLSLRAEIAGGPAGDCAKAFNALTETFQGIMGKVVFDAERVATAADELAKHAKAVAEGSDSQRQASQDMARAIDEMTSGVNTIAAHAGQAAGNAQEARSLSLAGMQVVHDASAEIERIARCVGQSAQVIGGLGERSEAISSIVRVIREIADQTNLLALNAAIEAARAGEAGRGFAVVADEVRKLAERTSTATTEISGVISAIQDETRAAITSINDGSQQAHVGAELAREAAQSLERINSGAQETMEKVDGIAVAIRQQGSEADKLVEHVREIMAMAERNSSGATLTLEEAKQLESLAANLKEINAVFKLGATGEQAMRTHQIMPALVQEAARDIGRALEQAVAAGQIREDDVFDRNYRPIANTNPQKYTTAFDALTDRLFPPIQEALLKHSSAIAVACAADINGYMPTHNKHCTQPLTGDYQKDFLGNRTKRIFDDPVSKRSSSHVQPYLMQTYRRDTGEVMHDISSPVYVNGRHWGGFRIAYRA
ncbi:MAG TPA: methyl-accepting chemotaxis protein [Rhodocyclaceae bacterium]|nr:methyl-accepting chemotaxis protein [Rhodocyclaceae bacterium]